MKQKRTYEIDRLEFDGPIDEVVKDLQDIKVKYAEHENLRVYAESTYDGGYYHYLRGERLETDAEEVYREDNEAKDAAQREASLRHQYEALKAKFEPSIKTEV
jgi:hypothetical protein